MKKKVFFAIAVVFVILSAVATGFYLNYRQQVATVMSSHYSVDYFCDIKVTAVGDCTFGTDVETEGALSFNSEYKNQNGDSTYFLKNVARYFEDDDLTIVNFEGTLSENGEREDKQFAFRGLPEYAKILTSGSVEAANIANNHSRDYGEISFADTKKILSENGIIWCEGKNYGFYEKGKFKVALVGTNLQRFDGEAGLLSRLEDVKREEPDLIIASFHWGEEGSPVPNETQSRLARLLIDNGADLVIGHHPHVLQGVEKYNGKYILYSLGNFCFGGNKNPKDKDTMIFKQTFTFKNGKLYGDKAYIVPCSISSVSERNNFQPTPLSGAEYKRVKQKIKDRSQGFSGIEDIEFVK